MEFRIKEVKTLLSVRDNVTILFYPEILKSRKKQHWKFWKKNKIKETWSTFYINKNGDTHETYYVYYTSVSANYVCFESKQLAIEWVEKYKEEILNKQDKYKSELLKYIGAVSDSPDGDIVKTHPV